MSNQVSRLSNKICPEGMSIEEWQVALRREQAQYSDFVVEHLDTNRIWGDYIVLSGSSRYKVAFRGVCSDRNYCSCLDFRTNGLGTCKHLEAVALHLQNEVAGYPWAGLSYNPTYTSIYVSYKGGRSIRMRIGSEYTEEFLQVYQEYFTEEGILPTEHYALLDAIQQKCTAISTSFRMYDDVLVYGAEVTHLQSWQESLRQAFPDERIPFECMSYASSKYIEEALYRLCYASNALVIAPRHNIAIMHIVASLAEEVYEGELRPQPGYIIVNTEMERQLWQNELGGYKLFKTLPVSIISVSEFTKIVGRTHPSVTFVWVDDAVGLKDWQNSLSLALKKLSIAHMYMRLETIQNLGPIQLSSTLQHIGPFVLGPLYQFVHKYRGIFPLSDDASNLPPEMGHVVHFLTDISEYTKPVGSRAEIQLSPSSQALIQKLMSSLLELAQDPQALLFLKQKLGC